MWFSRALRLPKLAAKVDFYSEFHPSPLSIQQYLDFGRSGDQKASYLFLRKELLVRLANIMKEISLLPLPLLETPSARLVQDWYHRSFLDLLPFEDLPSDEQNAMKFHDTITEVLKRHHHVVETMAEALVELKTAHGVEVSTERSLQYFLDRLYMNRISIRMLMNQHLMLFGSKLPDSPRLIGAIDPHCDVVAVIEDAFESARFLCEAYYMRSPGMALEAQNAVDGTEKINLVYIPSHLYHIVFELLKNALRAEVEFLGSESDDMPNLKIFVVKGAEDLSIKICDRGGGVPRSKVEMLFNYMYSTAPPPLKDAERHQPPLAGYGYGLPLARLYARYFQGEVFLVSMEGYGTDACIYIKALAVDANEVLPIYCAASRRNLRMGSSITDWSVPMGGLGNPGPGRAYSTLSSIHQLRLPIMY